LLIIEKLALTLVVILSLAALGLTVVTPGFSLASRVVYGDF
jgi:hypothetical protein